MRIITFLVFSFALLVFSGCKPKELNFKISGVILDNSSQQMINSGTVQLFEYPVGSITGLLKETYQLQADGKFTFDVSRGKVHKFDLVFNSHGYFPIERAVTFSELQPTEENFFQLETNSQSWVKFNIKNQLTPSSTDELKLLKSKGKNDCVGCCPNQYYFFYGVQDTIFSCMNDGNTFFEFYYWVNGTEIFKHDSIFCTPFDTLTYDIIY